ncbi:MAG: hypothetical protein H8D78_05020 [Chloroflexi bacterium]|nr:hypothetical protein [Chloroflexota bacterium]
MSTLNDARERINSGWQVLQGQWHTACGLWDDPVQRRFEREFWQEFERTVPVAMKQMRRLAEVIAQARREVR